eukprot:1158701-Pelagomonas_calceolata.AAC.10
MQQILLLPPCPSLPSLFTSRNAMCSCAACCSPDTQEDHAHAPAPPMPFPPIPLYFQECRLKLRSMVQPGRYTSSTQPIFLPLPPIPLTCRGAACSCAARCSPVTPENDTHPPLNPFSSPSLPSLLLAGVPRAAAQLRAAPVTQKLSSAQHLTRHLAAAAGLGHQRPTAAALPVVASARRGTKKGGKAVSRGTKKEGGKAGS